jgi:hypothetical protein
MKKVALTVFGILGLAASANAQGTWYTNQALWQSLVSNVSTADYTNVETGTSVIENGITAIISNTPTKLALYDGGFLGAASDVPITFTSSGNAFSTQCWVFAGIPRPGGQVAGSVKFSVDGSLTNIYDLPTTASGNTFLGYISNSASPISVIATPSTNTALRIDSFSFGQSTSSLGGSNIAPEPGSLTLAVTGGCALVGICIRRRRMSN